VKSKNILHAQKLLFIDAEPTNSASRTHEQPSYRHEQARMRMQTLAVCPLKVKKL